MRSQCAYLGGCLLMLEASLLPAINGCSPTQVQQRLNVLKTGIHTPIQVIQDRDPEIFLLKVLAGIQAQISLVLANPDWQDKEQQQLQAFLGRLALSDATDPTCNCPATIFIPTGGTSGSLTWIPHTLATLCTAAAGFQSHYPHTHSVVVLPPYHVSGLMPLFRALVNQGSLTVLSWSAFQASPPSLEGAILSLVPTQLQRLIRDPEWVSLLRGAEMILIGGAPLWPSLRQQCLGLGIPIALSYGMTETAAAAAVIPTQEMEQEGYTLLPHIKAALDPAGRIMLCSDAIPGGIHITDDQGAWDPQGRLLWQGRWSACVNTGGEKVIPSEVEAVIWESGLVEDIWVGGIPDPEWGERLIAVYVGSGDTIPRLRAYVRDHLAPYKCPKSWFPVAALPRQAQGKISRRALLTMIGLSSRAT